MAVHIGARRMGGMAYQLLAVFLTYSAIVMTYVPMIADKFIANESYQQEAQTAESDAGTDEGGNLERPVTRPGVEKLAVWIAAIPLAYMVPFLMGFDNAIGLLIIGFALWQSFRMNPKRKIDLQGPFRLEVRDAALG
jgi:hypothetical protein